MSCYCFQLIGWLQLVFGKLWTEKVVQLKLSKCWRSDKHGALCTLGVFVKLLLLVVVGQLPSEATPQADVTDGITSMYLFPKRRYTIYIT